MKKNQAKVNQTITNSESEQELSDDSLPEKMDYFFASNHALLFTNQNQKIGVNGSNLTISFLSLNRHKLSLKLLNSIAENMPDFQGEILIIDNGSDKQELLEIKSACAKLNFKYRIIELESNIGVSCGRNKALSLALTDWVMCLDNDIYFINNPLDIIQREISISGCHFFNLPLLDADGHNIFARGGHLYLSRHHSNILVGAGSVYTNETTTTIKDTHFFFSTFLFGGASIINRHTFLKYGGYDEALFVGFEDIDFSIRIFQEGLKVGNLSCLSLIHDHAKPEEVIDKNYEAKRFSREALYNSAIHLEKKHGLKFWHQGIDDWLESKNKTLEL